MTTHEQPQAAELTTGFVTSDDGTRIAYHTIGHGPGIVLLHGSLKPALSGLEKIIPNVERIEFPGLDHDASGDASKRNPAGRPEVVAAELRRFFTLAD
ncbi:hypothetical protein N5079_28600 [Planotetraspora sp. A-T 1434]|uniref:hypothetical protein n=1 Tax=Planotetraspora sp. A-T 1434 TaxID=2979219 RepID=UPI0021C13A54|nr:hypothetical protein [Planotetraspora sp. A-T 1434]MCT9934169.1 hypothetical protein [Planotetraspora sp. A-T 1434]